MAGANQSANQAQTKAQIKFPMTSALLLAVIFGGANHRANQIGCHPRLHHTCLNGLHCACTHAHTRIVHCRLPEKRRS